MYRALLPPTCPACGKDVPRAAAHRCPFCLTPFVGPSDRPAPASGVETAQERHARDRK